VRIGVENIRTYGSSPYEVAVIHGGPGAAGEMAPVARELSQYCGVLEPLQSALTIDEQIEELKNSLMKHRCEPISLIGYSWGALLSIITAFQYPEIVKKILLVSCPPLVSEYAKEIQNTCLDRLNDSQKQELDKTLKKLSDPLCKNKDDLMSKLGELLSSTDTFKAITEPKDKIQCRHDIFESIWSEAVQMRNSCVLLDYALNVKCPMTAIHGDYDPHPYKAVQDFLKDKLDNFVLLKKCGHSPWREVYAEKEFYQIAKDFVLKD